MYKFVKIGNLSFPEWELTCPDCKAKMELVSGESQGKKLMYRCSNHPKCPATHGAFNDGRPVGTPGNKKTRYHRHVHHAFMDPLWQKGHISRRRLYKRLSERLRLPVEDCHVGKLNAQQCQQLKGYILEMWGEYL
jgi:ssDNA-binding Zn-finger/Zn-ribbon topoisomerase 1